MRVVTQPALFPWWSLLADVLAAARLTRLIVKDALPPLKDTREMLLRRYRGSAWAMLWVCAWCFGFWVSLLVFGLHVLLAFTVGPTGVAVYAMVLAPLAISYIVGFLSDLEGA